MSRASRRRFLKLAASAGVLPALSVPVRATPEAAAAEIGDQALQLSFDARMRSCVAHRSGRGSLRLTVWAQGQWLALKGGTSLRDFVLEHHEREVIDGPYGRGVRLTLTGHSAAGAVRVEKRVQVALFERYPGFAFCRSRYRNLGDAPLAIEAWHNADVTLRAAVAGRQADEVRFWSFCGSSHEDRRDWVQPVRAGFAQDNYMGMSAADYGGGTPVVDVWRRDAGIAVGHVDPLPRLVSLPVRHRAEGVQLGISGKPERALAPGDSLETPETFLAVHRGDYFHTLDSYRRIMAEAGICAPKPPQAAYEGIWCAWGYERQCTSALIEGTLPKVEELGLRWAVIDDGWQTNVGDWQLNSEKYPQGAADMQRLVADIRARSLKPRLWVAPLAAAPGSDLLHDHTDMLLLDKEGAPQPISWWNSFYLCPAYPKTVEYTQGLVRRFIGEWGFAGLKIDGQHLNGVAPCYNPAHRHQRPEESVEKLADFFRDLYATALQLDPQVVMELCPCGTMFSFYNLPAINQTPASDPESSWQVRLKGKTLKALMGGDAPFAGDHVELSDGGDDFASTVGIGAIVSTKFTWPKDPKPKDSFLLTPEREALWRKWIGLYNERMLPKGIYRGELYDIGFDKPEAHAVAKDGRMYYAFYAPRWQGQVTLRGLAGGRHRVRDYFNGRELGEVGPAGGPLEVGFEHFLVLEAEPL